MHTILFDCERMKYEYVGLNDFCLYLGGALQKHIDTTKERIFCYMPSRRIGVLGNNVSYLKQHALHKFVLPSTKRFSVWHSTYQGSHYFPISRPLPIVQTVHDLNFMYDVKKPLRRKRYYLNDIKKKIARAEHVVTISQFVKDDIMRYDLLPAKKACSVIHNGCNQLDGKGAMTAPDFVPSRPFLFSLGTITRKKNFHVLPPLVRYTDMELVIAGTRGDKTYHEHILRVARDMGVADRVHLIGPVGEANKRWYLHHCAAFLFPSISEGFGLPVVEAMAFGKALVLSNRTSLPELGGNLAHYWENFDIEHMRQVLSRALTTAEDKNRKQALKNRAHLFSWARAAAAYVKIYRQLY